MENWQIIEAMLLMAKDDNQGVRLSTTITDVHHVSRGTIVSFGIERSPTGNAMKTEQDTGIAGRYMAFALFIDRQELKKYEEKINLNPTKL